MDELIIVMEEIRDILISINDKLDNLDDSVKDITSSGVYSLADIYSSLSNIELNMQ